MKQNKKEPFAYDRTLRDLFQDIPKGLVKLLSNKEAVEFLETKFPKVEEKEADLVVKLEDDTIFHLEIQSTDDKTMPKRMLQYALLIENIHGQFPLQSVLYIGEKEIEIKNSIKTEHINYQFDVKNIKEIDCSVLIESEDINDNILAILCKIDDFNLFFTKLRSKLMNTEESKRKNYLKKFFYLMRLRPKLYEKIKELKKEEKTMPIIIEKEKDPLYVEGLEKGIEKGIEKGMEKGMEKGIDIEKINLAKNLLINTKMDIEKIAFLTELDIKRVKGIKTNLEKGNKNFVR